MKQHKISWVWLKKVRLQKAFERLYVVDWSDGFRDGVPVPVPFPFTLRPPIFFSALGVQLTSTLFAVLGVNSSTTETRVLPWRRQLECRSSGRSTACRGSSLLTRRRRVLLSIVAILSHLRRVQSPAKTAGRLLQTPWRHAGCSRRVGAEVQNVNARSLDGSRSRLQSSIQE